METHPRVSGVFSSQVQNFFLPAEQFEWMAALPMAL